MALSVYYGNASTTDAQGVWTNDSNAINGNTSTSATATASGSTLSNALVINGASTESDTITGITQVRARIYARARGSSSYVYAYMSTGASPLGVPYVFGNTAGWSSWETLSTPSGGWTQAKLESIQAFVYLSGADTTNSGEIRRVEYEVTASNIEGNRYAIASGNWNNAAIWSNVFGGVGGVGEPNAGNYVNLVSNFTVTMIADAQCSNLFHENGSLVFNQYTLSIMGENGSFYSNWNESNNRTIDMDGGTLYYETGNYFGLGESAHLTFSAADSRIVMNMTTPASSFAGVFDSQSQTFADVIFYLGDVSSGATQLDISGSPTFNQLVIMSNNGSAHTVNIADLNSLTVSKFIAIGSGSSNKLAITGAGATPRPVKFNGLFLASYGQYVNITNVSATDASGASPPSFTAYIGSNSTVTSGSNWTLQDPMKIGEFVDDFTTSPGSNTNWDISGTMTLDNIGASGGGYEFGAGTILASTDSYDFVDSEFVIEFPGGTESISVPILGVAGGGSIGSTYLQAYAFYDTSDFMIDAQYFDTVAGEQVWNPTTGGETPGFIKMKINSDGTVEASYSENGTDWIPFSGVDDYHYDAGEIATMRSSKFFAISVGGSSTMGSLNFALGSSNPGAFIQFFL